MPRSTDFFGTIFDEADALVVVDDWKGSPGKFQRAPSYFSGRSFFARDPQLPKFMDLLREIGASSWHASGSRATHRFLFDQPRFADILAFLSTGETCLYDQLESVDAFNAPAIREKWTRILQQHPDLRATWDVDNPYAMSLFRFTDFLASRLDLELPAGSKLRILVDQLDWMSSRSHVLPFLSEGVGRLGWGERSIEVELLTILDRRGAGAIPYLPLMGLLDSEIWAFGRFNSLSLTDGKTIRDRYLEWQASGSPPSVSPVTEEEFAEAIAPYADRVELRAYWDALSAWGGERAVTLRERKPPATAV